MKVSAEWLKHFAYTNGDPTLICRRHKTDIDVPDTWAHRTNQKYEITKVGPYLELTRLGWVENRAEIERIRNHGFATIPELRRWMKPWPEYVYNMEQSLAQHEKCHDDLYAKMKENLARMEAYLKVIEPLRPPKA